MKLIFYRIIFIALVFFVAFNNSWAASGLVVTNADIDFGNDIIDGIVSGNKNSMSVHGTTFIQDGVLRSVDDTNVVTIDEGEYAGREDVVTISFDKAWGNKQNMGSGFRIVDSEGEYIATFQMARWDGKGTNANTMNIDMSGLSGSHNGNKPIYDRATHFEISIDYKQKLITTVVSCPNPNATKTFTANLTSTKPVAKFEHFSYGVGDNTDRSDSFDNLKITATISSDTEVKVKNQPGEFADTPLSKDMYKTWDGFDNYAKPIPAAEVYAEFNFGTEKGQGAVIYGNASVLPSTYADITGTTVMRIIGTPGLLLRILLNRQADYSMTERQVTIGENGKGELDLSPYEYVHLNAIKIGWSETGAVESVILNPSDAEEKVKNEPGEFDNTPLTKDMFKGWDGFDDYAKVNNENPYWDAPELPAEIGAGATVYGSGNITNSDYADITGADVLRINGTSGMQFRVLMNRQVDNSLIELNPIVGEEGYVDVDLSEYEYVHINAIKTGWGSAAGTVESIILNPSETEEKVIMLDTDMTNAFAALTEASNWINYEGGSALWTLWACPEVEVNKIGKKPVCEFYLNTCDYTGDVLYQTVSGLVPGLYKIELYGGAAFTFGRGFGSTAFTGDFSVDSSTVYGGADGTTGGAKIEPTEENPTGVSLTATTSVGTYGGEIPIYYAQSFPEGVAVVTLDGVEVGDNGEVKLAMTKTSTSTNWHVIQLKGVTAQVNAKDALAAAVAAAEKAAEQDIPQAVKDEVAQTIVDNNKLYNTDEEYQAAIDAINVATAKANESLCSEVVYQSDFDNEKAGCIPTGWKTYNEAGYHIYGFIDEARTQQINYNWGGNIGGGGSRLYAGFSGYFNKALYWGTCGTNDGYASYGELVKDYIREDGSLDPEMPEGISLYLEPCKYQIYFQMAAWKAEPHFDFTLEDLDGNIYAESKDYLAAPNMNGAIGNVSDLVTCQAEFTVYKAGYYVLKFTSAKAQWQEFLLANVRLITMPLKAVENWTFDANPDDVITVTTQDYRRNIAEGSGQITGLQTVTGWTPGEQTASDPGFSAGIFAYGSTNLLNNKVAAPPAAPEGSESPSALGLSALWGGVAQYTQSYTFQPGNYKFTYTVYNGANTRGVTKNLFGFITEDGTEYLSDKKNFTVGEWETVELNLTFEEETTGNLSVGFIGGGGSGNAPHLFVDRIEVEQLSEEEIASVNLKKEIEYALIALAKYVVGDMIFQYPQSEIQPLTDVIANAQEILDQKDATADVLNMAISTLRSVLDNFNPQFNKPSETTAYKFALHGTDKMMLCCEGGEVRLGDNPDAFYFVEQDNGSYAIMTSQWKFVSYKEEDSDNGNIGVAIDKYEWTFVAQPDGGYKIIGVNGIWGTNDELDSSFVLGNKSLDSSYTTWMIERFSDEYHTVNVAETNNGGVGFYWSEDDTELTYKTFIYAPENEIVDFFPVPDDYFVLDSVKVTCSNSSLSKNIDIFKLENNGFRFIMPVSDVIIETFFKGIYAVNPDEWEILLEVYDELSSMGWENPWDMSLGADKIGIIPGITVEQGHVSMLGLSGQGLTGEFPNSIIRLPKLKQLNLSNNHLNGDINACIEDSSEYQGTLEVLDISNNMLTGNIGEFASRFTNLYSLNASSNCFNEVSPMISEAVTSLNLSRQTVPNIVSVHILDLLEKPIEKIVPDILLYDHKKHEYSSDITLHLNDSANESIMSLTYNNDVAEFMLLSNDNVYYGESGDVFSVSSANGNDGSSFKVSLSFDDGDSNFDGDVNVLDLQTTINYMFEENGSNLFNYTAANLWVDEVINVQDAVCLVNLLLDHEENGGSKRRRVRSMAEEKSVNADAALFVDNGMLRINTAVPVSAFDIVVKDVQQAEMSDELKALGFICAIRQTSDGGVHIVGYSLSGEEIPSGIFTICRLTGGEVVSAMLANRQAREIRVALYGSTTSVTAVDGNRQAKEVYRFNMDSRHTIIVDENGNKILMK